MLEQDVTWGQLRAIHRSSVGIPAGANPDDILADPEMLALSKTKGDDEYYFDISPETAANLKAIRAEYDYENLPGTVSVTISRTGEVLELIKTTDTDVLIRDGGAWYVVHPDTDEPRVFDQTLADVSEDFVEYWDRLRSQEAEITKEVIQDYLV